MALKNQADPNNVSLKGVHVLHMMCEKADECTPLCLILLDAGADPNARNKVRKRKKVRKEDKNNLNGAEKDRDVFKYIDCL